MDAPRVGRGAYGATGTVETAAAFAIQAAHDAVGEVRVALGDVRRVVDRLVDETAALMRSSTVLRGLATIATSPATRSGVV